ncbi:hypothetical protein FB451DRAFT_1191696 [Mycena latifolia]|nr:hypothetical protein FB451DRAFT_1191696 [Mycena latifolia]
MQLQLSLLFVVALAMNTFAAPASSASASASVSAPAPSASLCTPQQLEQRELPARAPPDHPSANNAITLFHGTIPANAAEIIADGINLALGTGSGDFHHRPEVDGGFYLTDSIMVAAQFACYGKLSRPDTVEILEFGWNPAGALVFEFPGQTADWESLQEYNNFPVGQVNVNSPFRAQAAAIYMNDMITGPMDAGPADVLITPDAWQYAVVHQVVAKNNLHLQNDYKGILCKNVPQAARVDTNLYVQGQAGNAQFAGRLAKLQDPNYSPGGGQFKCTIQ